MKILIGVVLFVIGVLGIVVGVVYFVEPAHSLPSFFPSHAALHAASANVKHTKKGVAAVVVGGLLVVIGIVVALVPSRPASTTAA